MICYALITIALGIVLLMKEAEAGSPWKLIELRESYINYKYFVHPGRDPLFTDLPHKEELNLHVNTDILRYMYWDNMVHSMTDASQYRVVGLNTKLGVRLSGILDVQFEHFSKHMLDTVHPWMRGFPVEDSVGINLYLYRPDKPRSSLLP
jgi:hypothetical protein